MISTIRVLVVLILFPFGPAFANEPLSASDNRWARMSDLCQRQLELTADQCSCIFSKSFETRLSNVDLSFYYGGQNEKLSAEALSTLDNLRRTCTQPDTVGTTSSGPSQHTALCESKSNMDPPRCSCFLRKAEASNYAANDIEMFLRGRASKVSEFSLYTEMTIHLLDCEKEVIRGQ
ncbi:hypothetical protein SAMN06265374_3085 [Roseibium denhamense]|uniref:Uncharacterized protein n=1 Tax=Roseibium denhamense TaxID=76305 RepID=A0ABY1P9B0_9HYPH|nr:hypothetical protein SAMN06265374_3085 [Roseibium denhamense]